MKKEFYAYVYLYKEYSSPVSAVRIHSGLSTTIPQLPVSFKGPRYLTLTIAIYEKNSLRYFRFLSEARMAGDLNIPPSISKQIIRQPIDDSRRLLRVYHTDTLESIKANKTLDRRPKSKEIL